MILIKIIGGLGNQLFQYAFGIYTASLLNSNAKFDIHTDAHLKNFTKRKLDIENFNVTLCHASSNEVKKYVKFHDGLWWRIERKLVQTFSNLNPKYKVQKNAHEVIHELQDNAYYDGYWQCHVYPDKIREKLLDEIVPDPDFHNKFSDILSEINQNSSVAIHIRRDDYINIKANEELFEVCDMNYYEQAIQIIEKKINAPKYLIFTQDKDWAKENFKGKNFEFVEENSAIEDMLLMSMCKHNIIANSTFSWWSAWLNQNPDKIVVAPKKWYKGKRNLTTKSLIPENWHRI